MSRSSIILSWNEAKDKKVKSSDEKDLGKIYNATKDYIEIKEGKIGKKTYFIPKYYVQGYDGDSIWVSLRKDDVKERFEKEKPPVDMSEFETPDYVERRDSVKTLYPDFDEYIPRYAPVPGASTTTVRAPPSTKAVTVFWDNLKGKKVKSNDDEDLGKVKVVGPHYVEVQEGLIGKKSYFIPKYYFESFDGEKLHVSLSKDEIKEKWKRGSPPSESEVESQAYLEHKKRVDEEQQFVDGVPLLAPEPGVTLKSDVTGEEVKIEWANVIHKHVRASDNVDIGDVERVGKEYLVVRQGVAKVHVYYVPKACVSNYDGSYLYLNVPNDFARKRFERDNDPTPEEVEALVREAKTKAEDQKLANAPRTKQKESALGSEARKDDPLTSYREKEPMTPAKIKEHEPTAVKRDMTEKIGKGGTDSNEAAEIARKKGMAKGTAGAGETGSEYEQGAAGTNK